jgi:hypothetical protein
LLADIVIPTDVNQLTDVDGLLGSGGGGGGGGNTLPSQTGNAGKVLTTDGTNLSWTTVSAGSSPTFTTVNTTTLNVQTVAFTGTGAVTIESGNDLNLVAAGDITFNGKQLSTVATSGSYSDLTNKPSVNYTQTIGNPVSVPASATLPYTIISGTITTTGNPVRIHVCGDLYQASGGWPRIQIFRDTSGLGRRMTVRNAGVAGTPFAIEVVDPVPAGTYTYSLKVVSDLANGVYFGQEDGNMLNIVELK